MSPFRIADSKPLYVYEHPMFSREINWAHHIMNLEEAWAKVTGKGVRVGIIDTGCDYAHPDLHGKVCGGINCTKDHTVGYMDGDSGHGTSVASIVAARKTGKGVAGVAPDAELFICKCIDAGGVGDADFIKCSIEACITAGCDVINMSLGSPEAYPEVEEAIRKGVDKNIIFVAAAGNSGDIDIKDNDGLPLEDFPARLPYVISVAAIDKKEQHPDWSSTGHIEFSAPGVDIVTCFPGGKYSVFSGTSQASPFIAGVCALLKECDPTVDFEKAVNILSQHSLHIGDSKEFGAGIINVGSAVNAYKRGV